MSEPEMSHEARLADSQRRGREVREEARRQRKASQALASAYHVAKSLSTLMSMIVFDLASLPESEQRIAVDAAEAALNAFRLLDSVIIDVGNISNTNKGELT